MYKIIHKQIIAQDIKKIDITAPAIVARCLPGQFVMVTPAAGEQNIPMTIVDSDERRGVISLIVHETSPDHPEIRRYSHRRGALSDGGAFGPGGPDG